MASILATGGCVEGQPRQWGYPHLLGRKAEAKPSKDTKPPKVILGAEPDPQPDPVAAGRDEAAR